MKINAALAWASPRLKPIRITCAADKDVGRLEAEILLAHVLKKDRIWLVAHSEGQVQDLPLRRFRTLVRRRQKHEPIAYILGKKDFYGRTFAVNKNVLIPRPETELLIDLVRTPSSRTMQARRGQGEVIWDVGTGSGAIAITLAKELPDADILASDVSSSALAVARKNAKRLGATNVTFFKADLLNDKISKTLRSSAKTNASLIITANLPYLPLSDKQKLEPDVVKFEPSHALFTGRDGLELIIRFLDQVALALHEWKFKTVTLLLEYDPPQTKQLLKIAKSTFPGSKIQIHKDLAGRNRVIEIHRVSAAKTV